MRTIVPTTRFRRDVQRQKRRGLDSEKITDIAEHLARNGRLPSSFRPHPLSGRWKGIWDCHIAPDWLLLYEVTDTKVVLHRTGTHADLFE